MKKFRKLISSALVAVMVLSSIAAYADVDSKVISRIKSLGIMAGDEGGEMHLDSNVSRAEMAAIVVRMNRIEELSVVKQKTVFADVTEEYWGSGYIAMATSMGIINGMGDGTYLPEAEVSYQDVIKMLVCTLGYDVMAQELGGYPNGYLTSAANLGITKNVVLSQQPAVRGDIATMIYNALEVVPLVQKYGNPGEYEEDASGRTLYEMFLNKDDIKKIKGILTQTKFTSLDSVSPSVKDDYIMIDDGDPKTFDKYKTSLDLNNYIGYSLECYARYLEDQDIWEIINAIPNVKDNEKTSFDQEYTRIYDDRMELQLENGKVTTYAFSPSIKYVYNGRLIDAAVAPKDISNGKYYALDNTGDDNIDILFIDESESFIIKKVSKNNSTVYFMNRELYRGKDGFKFDFDTQGNKYQIIDENGEDIGFDGITVGLGITLIVSADGTYGKAYISNKTVEGEITLISDDNKVEVDGEEYEIAKNSQGKTWFTPKVGDEGTYVIDVYGKLIDISGVAKSDYKFAYVINTNIPKGLSSGIELKLVSGTAPEKQVKVKAGTEIISYEFQNDVMFTLTSEETVKYGLNIEDNIIFNDKKGSQLSLIASEVKGKVIKYKLSSEGKIKEFDVFAIPKSFENSAFNADIMAFGGETVTRGYSTTDKTTFICIPKKLDTVDEDFDINVKLTDKGKGYNVYGITVDPEKLPDNLTDDEKEEIINGEPVDFLVIVADMDSTNPANIASDADVCIVGNLRLAIGEIGDDQGSNVYKIDMLNGEDKVTEITTSDGEAFDVAATLGKGDLVQVAKDGYGRITNIKMIGQVQGLGNNYGSLANGAYYGLVTDVRLDLYDFAVNGKVDYVRLRFNDGTDNKLVKIFRKDTQPIYIYERSTGWIYPGTSEDIVSENQVGEGSASKVYAYYVDGDATAIIIIKD